MEATKAHCNKCGGERNHDILHSEREDWQDEEARVSQVDIYQTLRCRGCESIKLRHMLQFSEDEEPTVHYYPPAIFRRNPEWFAELWLDLDEDDQFVEAFLKEIYVALQNNLPTLAAMGVRALLERTMISRVEDQGTFGKNLDEFEKLGHVSKVERQRLETILDAGHAAIHREYTPKVNDVVTLLDITEHIVASVFLHGPKVEALKKSVPVRKPRAAAKKPA